MKKFLIKKILIVFILTVSVLALQVNAAIDTEFLTSSVNSLVKLQVMRGDENGNLNLDNNVTRAEFTTMVIRMLGYDKAVNTGNTKMLFTDIAANHWAYNYIKIAVDKGLITGYTDNTVKPNNNVTFTEARAILVRALGYDSTMSGKWPDNVINKSEEIGLNKFLDLHKDKELSRGEAAGLIYNSLVVDFNR
jgi:hypothetical protein